MKKKSSHHAKTTHKTTVHHVHHRRKHHHDRRSHDIYLNALAKFAMGFIDQTSGLLKKGIQFTSETTEKGKESVKKAALDLIDGSSQRLHAVVRTSSHLMRKGVGSV
jgi:hypothetical protein